MSVHVHRPPGGFPVMQRRVTRFSTEWVVSPYWIESALALGRRARGRTLVVGIGCGYTILEALRAGARVTALEVDPEIVRLFEVDERLEPPLADRAAVEVVRGDLATWRPYSGTAYETVLCDIEDREAFQAARWGQIVKRADGRLWCAAFHDPPAGMIEFAAEGDLRGYQWET